MRHVVTTTLFPKVKIRWHYWFETRLKLWLDNALISSRVASTTWLHKSFFSSLPLLEFQNKVQMCPPIPDWSWSRQNTNRSFFKAQMVMTLSVFSHVNQLPIGHTAVHCTCCSSAPIIKMLTLSLALKWNNPMPEQQAFSSRKDKKSQDKIPKQRRTQWTRLALHI